MVQKQVFLMSVITLKLKYECDKKDRILELVKNYNSIFGIAYNFMFDHQDIKNPSEIRKYINNKNNDFCSFMSNFVLILL